MKDLRIIIYILFLLTAAACRQVPEPPSPGESDIFVPCIPYPGSGSSLDIVTFNIETFPLNGYSSAIAVASLLNTIDADIYALQEVASEASFNQLISLMPGYSGLFYLINNSDWNLAYIWKTSEISVSQGSARLLFSGSEYFPRPPFEISIMHKNTGLDLILINNHLKCCGGFENETSRRMASLLLKDYIDNDRADDAVIILGDLNDEITGTGADENPFLNFINDPENYRFADMEIASGSQLWWSYPSWPSHIDHILITDELFFNLDTTMVYKAAPCYPEYSYYISDHRPVGIKLVAAE
ncbi:MAG TPA: endonuclease/exonuclease/phosphatase family protein [Bacteroidales bacterium]|nr:endonuclease/exonuclease/phosphatase family protein [Bacteroidales bacterium]HPJ59139.1 endonuclease/exonuclease/phosphatase family protein [Bacteroidales bacterium]HPR12751.1 endonuclease/exonuclease/phosphatase family protein [Bacteroidales bacterium]HRW84355.1 endonuclease/exonuclease/phosphatase family protein [Bacteroidales bacterium]